MSSLSIPSSHCDESRRTCRLESQPGANGVVDMTARALKHLLTLEDYRHVYSSWLCLDLWIVIVIVVVCREVNKKLDFQFPARAEARRYTETLGYID